MSTATQTRMIPVEQIDRGKFNPNGRVQGPAYDEFREDVRKHGVLQAVLVREHREAEADGPWPRYFLIAGHRRLQAAIDTMIEQIPAVVIESAPSSDDELRLIENLHRADLDPVTEAEAYRTMAKEFGAEGPAEIATRVGKPVGHVRRRLSLLRVSKAVLDAVRAGELQLRVAELVGSIDDTKLREKAAEEALSFEWDRRPASVADMRTWLARHIGHELSEARWDLADATLVAGDPCRGACRDCAFNTANQGELFGDVGKAAACMSAAGWAAKTKAYFDRRSEEVKAAGGTVLSPVEAKAFVQGKSAGRFVRASDMCHQDPKYRTFAELAGKDLALRAVALVNGEIIEAVDGKAAIAAAKKRGIDIRPAAGAKKAGPTAAEKRAKTERKTERVTVTRALEQVVRKAEEGRLQAAFLLDVALAHVGHAPIKEACIRRGWAPKKDAGGWSPMNELRKRMAEMDDLDTCGLLVELLVVPAFPADVDRLRTACAVYDVDWNELLKVAEAELDGVKPVAKPAAPRAPRGERPRRRGIPKAARTASKAMPKRTKTKKSGAR